MVQKSLKKNAVYSFIKAFMNLAFPLISFPYASRILLPAGIGKVNFANSVIEYFTLAASLGIFSYAAREAVRVRDDKYALNKIFREILTINLISTVISYILLFFALFFVSKFSEYRILLIVCSTKILFTTIGVDWIFNVHEEYKYIHTKYGQKVPNIAVARITWEIVFVNMMIVSGHKDRKTRTDVQKFARKNLSKVWKCGYISKVRKGQISLFALSYPLYTIFYAFYKKKHPVA